FLADESCDFRVIRALRAAGHDVVAVAEVAAGAEDGAIIEMAMNQGRIFVIHQRQHIGMGAHEIADVKYSRGFRYGNFPLHVSQKPADACSTQVVSSRAPKVCVPMLARGARWFASRRNAAAI